MDLKSAVQNAASQALPDIINVRRHLHAHPELSFKEYETSKFVAEQLRDIGIPFQDGIVETGLVGLIEGRNPESKVIALRADMDALPILEANNVDYKSQNEGIMHACGHDVHTSSLLGTARILNSIKDSFDGTVKLIFQPGEERLPGGASLMIKEGVLENPAPGSIIGQHVFPELEAGKVGFRSGMYMASADEIYVTVTGKGGHAALPHKFVDPVLIASQMIVALQQLVSREIPPHIPSVLSFGRIIGEGSTNVIPNEVKLEGTFRIMNEEWRKIAHDKMRNLAHHIAAASGGTVDFDIQVGYPFLVNDEVTTNRAKAAAEQFLGAENVVELGLRMTAEDFAYFTQHAPSCFYRLGVANHAKGITSNLHTPTFNIDESALETGMGLMAWITLQELAAK